MTKKLSIAVEKPIIDIQLGDITLEFPIDDDSLLKIKNQAVTLENQTKNIQEKYGDDIQDFEPHKELLSSAFESFFGPGTFEKVYAQTPSVRSCTKYFMQICEHLIREITIDKEIDELSSRFIRKK